MGVATQVAAEERAVDGLRPTRVERPRTTEELSAVITAADSAREAIVLWGGGTRIGVGDPPDRYDIAADLTGLAGIVEHSPADLVCTVRAGTTLADLASALRPSGKRWPVDAPCPAAGHRLGRVPFRTWYRAGESVPNGSRSLLRFLAA